MVSLFILTLDLGKWSASRYDHFVSSEGPSVSIGEEALWTPV
jgi:hypothetical protein